MNKKAKSLLAFSFAILAIALCFILIYNIFVSAASNAPTGLHFEGNETIGYDSDGTFSLNWTSGGGDAEASYTIWMSSNAGGIYDQYSNDSPTGYYVTGGIDAENYTFKVQAVNATGNTTANVSSGYLYIDTTSPLVILYGLDIDYVNFSGFVVGFAGGENISIGGYANDTLSNIKNWTLEIWQNDVFNSTICSDTIAFNNTENDSICGGWNTTEFCPIGNECENVTLILRAYDNADNENETNSSEMTYMNLSSISVDNNYPYIDPIANFICVYNGDTRCNATFDVSDTYLSEVSGYVLNKSNYTVIGWGHLCNESQGDECNESGSGTYNHAWNLDSYSLNGDIVPVYYKFNFAAYGEGTNWHLSSVLGCLKANASVDYDCGQESDVCVDGGDPEDCITAYKYWLVYNFSEQQNTGELYGITQENWCFNNETGCVINQDLIINGETKFIPQLEQYNGQNTWTYENLSEIDVSNIGNASNLNLTYAQPSGYYDFLVQAEDYFWMSDSVWYDGFAADFDSPQIIIHSPLDDSYQNWDYLTINWTVNDTNYNHTYIELYNSTDNIQNDTINYTFGPYIYPDYIANYTSLPDETYRIVLTAYDIMGRTANQTKFDIVIDTVTPTNLSAFTVSSIAATSAVISSTFNEAVNCTILYGTNETDLSSTKSSTTFNLNGRVSLTGLTAERQYYYNISECTDPSGNNQIMNYGTDSFNTTRQSGGGGASGGSTTTINQTEENKTILIITMPNPNQTTFDLGILTGNKNGKQMKVGFNETFRFVINGIVHVGRIVDISGNRITLWIWSTPIQVIMSVGETAQLDLDGDGKDDLLLTLNGISNGNADFVFKDITAITEPQNNTQPLPTGEPKTTKDIWVWILLGILGLGLIIFIYSLAKSKKRRY